jgi:hypothetical protein
MSCTVALVSSSPPWSIWVHYNTVQQISFSSVNIYEMSRCDYIWYAYHKSETQKILTAKIVCYLFFVCKRYYATSISGNTVT